MHSLAVGQNIRQRHGVSTGTAMDTGGRHGEFARKLPDFGQKLTRRGHRAANLKTRRRAVPADSHINVVDEVHRQ